MNIFISYSHDDKEIALKLCNIIRKYNFNPILDEKDIVGGQVIDERVAELLEDSSIIIVIISLSSIKSAWVFYEIGRSDQIGKIIIPFLTDPRLLPSLPIFLQKRKIYTKIEDIDNFLNQLSRLEIQESILLPLYWSGIKKIYKKRAVIPNYFEYFVKKAKKIIRAMFVNGNFFSAVNFENILKTKHDVLFKILLLEPSLVYIRNKDLSPGEYKIKQSEWDTVLSTASKFSNLEIRFYNIYPFWHIILVDNTYGAMSFNPIGKLGYNYSPVYIFENNNQPGNFFEIFDNYFEIIWRDSKRYKPIT